MTHRIMATTECRRPQRKVDGAGGPAGSGPADSALFSQVWSRDGRGRGFGSQRGRPGAEDLGDRLSMTDLPGSRDRLSVRVLGPLEVRINDDLLTRHRRGVRGPRRHSRVVPLEAWRGVRRLTVRFAERPSTSACTASSSRSGQPDRRSRAVEENSPTIPARMAGAPHGAGLQRGVRSGVRPPCGDAGRTRLTGRGRPAGRSRHRWSAALSASAPVAGPVQPP